MVFCIGAVFLKEKRCSAWCDKKEALIFLLVGLFSSIIFYLEYIFSWFSFSFIKRKENCESPHIQSLIAQNVCRKPWKKTQIMGYQDCAVNQKAPCIIASARESLRPRESERPWITWYGTASLLVLGPRQTSSRFTRLKCSRRWKKRASCSAENEGLSALRPKIVRLFYFYNSASRRMPRYIRVAREKIRL